MEREIHKKLKEVEKELKEEVLLFVITNRELQESEKVKQ
jgi:hypothetical protein